jgi:integrase/recombinase XerD
MKKIQKEYPVTSDKCLNIDEQKAIRSQINKTKNGLYIGLLYFTGARTSEILGVRKKDLHKDNCSVFITGLKGSKDRDIPIPKNFFSWVMEYSKDMDNDERLFKFTSSRARYIWGDFRPIGCRKSLRSLRHTFGVNLYRKTKDIRLVQLTLGHKSISNTEIYVDYVYSQDEMRKAMYG